MPGGASLARPTDFELEGKTIVEKYFCLICKFVPVVGGRFEIREANKKDMPVERLEGQVKIQFCAKIATAVILTEKVIAQVELPRRLAPVNP